MSKPIRFVMLGGFLGAGKTTTLGRLAAHYTSQGLNVGIVTNDQAAGLVDTGSLRAQGFDVGEVAGACFCCQFNELTDVISKLSSAHHPDVILAEPVGSCTDLIATVIQPLKQLHAGQFTIAPYGVILKPSHGQRILIGGAAKSGFSPKAEYILTKQLEEADAILINRIDELSTEELATLEQAIGNQFPETPLLKVSAKTGEGFDEFLTFLEKSGDYGRKILEIDYDIYAEGEAELGWLNSSVSVSSETPFLLDEVLMSLIGELHTRLQASSQEPAHLKVIGLSDGEYGVANLISSQVGPELSLPCGREVTQCQLVVNARVACTPDELEAHVKAAVETLSKTMPVECQITQTQCLRPGRPVPVHRMQSAV